MPKARDFQNLIGKQFNRLTVVAFDGFRQKPSGKRRVQWLCRCECGNTTSVAAPNLKSGNSKSCGCHNLEVARSRATHRSGKSSEYKSWNGLKDRCLNPKSRVFHRYGGRGITVCERWQNSFENFIADMGPKPTAKHSIDRIDNEKGYFPENCKWSNQTEQTRNTRRNRLLTLNGATRCMTEWSEITGLGIGTIWKRKKLGWSDARALTEPLR